jgi:plastocyanin
MRRLLVSCVILMLMPGVAWAGGGHGTSACTGFGEGTAVSMQDSCFTGTAHFAPSGTTINVTNDGGLPHTLTAVDGSFDTGQVAPGSSVELTIDEPGIYRVFCSLHGTAQGEGMAGVLIVGEAAAGSVAAPSDTLAVSPGSGNTSR